MAHQPADRTKVPSERKIYLLPPEMVDRIRAYQDRQGISSETEAVRRLLDAALQLSDTASDLLNKLGERFLEERDLRVLARDVLAHHTKVAAIRFPEGIIEFEMADGGAGRMERNGDRWIGDAQYGNWERFPRPKPQPKKIEDDIPF